MQVYVYMYTNHTYICTYYMTNVNMAARERTKLKETGKGKGSEKHTSISWAPPYCNFKISLWTLVEPNFGKDS